MDANIEGLDMQEFRQRSVEKIDSAIANIEIGLGFLDSFCDDLKPDSTIYVLLFGRIMPEIRHLIRNTKGDFCINDLKDLLTIEDLRNGNTTQGTG